MFHILRLMYEELNKPNSAFYRDPRTRHLPLVGSPVPMICVIVLYILFVTKWGSALMAKRQPMDLKLPMQMYNVMQVLLNLYVVIGCTWNIYAQSDYRILCHPYDTQDTRTYTMNLRYPAYVYYITKYLDLLDTVFFVLRKKDRQISFLHVYHHAGMIYAVWIYMTLNFGPHYALVGILNSFIHVLMYSYYFFAAWKPAFDLNPWKRVLTQMQIMQFLCVSLYLGLTILRNTCQLDLFWTWLGFIENIFLLILFCDFYIRTYIKKPQATVEPITVGKSLKNN